MSCSKCEPSFWARQIDITMRTVFTAGTALAVTYSYQQHHSKGWAVIHGLGGWFYVLLPSLWPTP
jgi:hypothetical protein